MLRKPQWRFSKENERIKITWFDWFVTCVVVVVFYYAIFFASFKVVYNPDGTIMYINKSILAEPSYENGKVVYHHLSAYSLNLQVIIAPLILLYEFLIIAYSDKIRRLRGLLKPALGLFFLTIREKKEEGIELTKEYLQRDKR